MDWGNILQITRGITFGRVAGIVSLIGLLVYAKSMLVWPKRPLQIVWFFHPLRLYGYLRGVSTGKEKPSRATWFIWTLNSVLLLPSYSASGAEDTVWLSAGYMAGCFIIALLTIKFGEGGWSRLDRFCLSGAVAGALLWAATGSALTMFVITLGIDILGVLPTIKKSWQYPDKEDVLAWSILLLGGVVSLFAVKEWSFTLLSLTVMAYPIQITFTTAIIVLFLLRPKIAHRP